MILGAALLWASGATVGKFLFTSGVTALELVQVRSVLSAVAIAGFFAIEDRGLFAVSPRTLPGIALLGGLALAGTQICYFEAIESTHVAVAILLQYMSVVLVFVFSAAVWKERVTPVRVAAVAGSLGGCFLVVGGADIDTLTSTGVGIAWGLGAAVCFAAYTLGTERLVARSSPWTVLFWALVFCAITCHAIDPSFSYVAKVRQLPVALGMLHVSILGTAIPFGLYTMGIARIRSTRASVAAVSEPVFAAIMAFAFLGETPGISQIVGGLVVGGSIVLLRIKDIAKEGVVG